VAAGSSAVVVGAVRVAVAVVVADAVAPLGGLPRFLCGFIIVLRFARVGEWRVRRGGVGEGAYMGKDGGERVYIESGVRGLYVRSGESGLNAG